MVNLDCGGSNIYVNKNLLHIINKSCEIVTEVPVVRILSNKNAKQNLSESCVPVPTASDTCNACNNTLKIRSSCNINWTAVDIEKKVNSDELHNLNRNNQLAHNNNNASALTAAQQQQQHQQHHQQQQQQQHQLDLNNTVSLKNVSNLRTNSYKINGNNYSLYSNNQFDECNNIKHINKLNKKNHMVQKNNFFKNFARSSSFLSNCKIKATNPKKIKNISLKLKKPDKPNQSHQSSQLSCHSLHAHHNTVSQLFQNNNNCSSTASPNGGGGSGNGGGTSGGTIIGGGGGGGGGFGIHGSSVTVSGTGVGGSSIGGATGGGGCGRSISQDSNSGSGSCGGNGNNRSTQLLKVNDSLKNVYRNNQVNNSSSCNNSNSSSDFKNKCNAKTNECNNCRINQLVVNDLNKKPFLICGGTKRQNETSVCGTGGGSSARNKLFNRQLSVPTENNSINSLVKNKHCLSYSNSLKRIKKSSVKHNDR